MRLLLNALFKFLFGLVLVFALIFLPAGNIGYMNGWLFIALLFVPMLFLGIVLFAKAPKLLRERLDGKEKENTQKGVQAFSAFAFLAGFIVAGLDFRFGWSAIPFPIIIVASVLFLGSYLLYCEVMRENEYLSRTVKVQDGQKVIDTGLYGIVRHPMYMITLVMFLMIPIVLGSLYSLIAFLHYPIIIVIRIINEEKVLTKGLEGYSEYKKKVRYRLIPFIW